MGFFSALVGAAIGFFFGGPVGAAVGAIAGYAVEEVVLPFIADLFTPEIPEFPESPTYGSDRIGNTISEGIFVSRCYGTCKLGGNKIRFNDPDATDLRIIVAHCLGEIEGVSTWYVNDLEWSTLTGAHTKTAYTGTRTQTADARFSTQASTYRGFAYTALTFVKNDKQVGYDPNITVILSGLKCLPLLGGATAFTRNNAVILYDWYLNVEGYSADALDLNAFKSLEALCNEVPSGSTLPRYRFDYNIDTDVPINDAKKIMWQSFNGRVIMSQGKLKPVWDSAQMADGAGGLTAKTVSHAFTEDNIIKDSLTWSQPERPNIVRIHYLDSTKNYKRTSVEEKDERDIELNGEILYEENCWFITDSEIARRRVKFKFNRLKYTDYVAKLSAFSGASDLEVYDLTTVTHQLPGWTDKQFLVTSKGEDAYGQMSFILEAYYPGVYDDAQVGDQTSYESNLPNPYGEPASSTNITATLVSPGIGFDYDSVKVSFTPPVGDPFYAKTEIYASNDDETYYLMGTSTGEPFVIQGMGMIYQPGDTCYIKLRNINDNNVKANIPAAYDTSVVITSSIRLGGFYATLTTLGDNITPADAGILLDKETSSIRLGPTSADYLILDGVNVQTRSSNYASGVFGSGFLLSPDLLEVGNIACRGIFRTACFQKDVVSAIGGNLAVLDADVLDVDMTALDACNLSIEGNTTLAVGDILRSKAGISDEWMEVTDVSSAPIYVVTRDKAGSYAADNNPAWTKGAAVVNYKQSGSGGVYLTASDSNAPYISVFTHAGSPWSSLSTKVRLGNLNGFLGYATDLYGIAIGEAEKYLKYDPTNGLRIKGTITVTGGNASVTFYQAAAPSGVGEKEGDYWIDTDDSNKLYTYQSGAWVEISAGGGITTFRQSAIPVAVTAGDLWIDTDNNKLYRATNAGDDQIIAGEWELQNAAIATGWAHTSDTTKIDGGTIYTGTIIASAINVTSLSAINANLGTITAGLAKSSDNKLQVDFDNKWIKVWDAQATPVLRVHLGYIP